MKFKTAAIIGGCLAVLFAVYFASGDQAVFEVRDGETGSAVARELKERKIILSEFCFKASLKIAGAQRKIKPGKYVLRKHMSSPAALWQLIHFEGQRCLRVVIPEGWRLEQTAERLEALRIAGKEDFISIARGEKLEGRLFPSTYFFEEKTPARHVVAAMLKEFDQAVGPILENRPPGGLSRAQVLALASIVEREATNHSERPLIAAVYLNRLARGMGLEADPTVQYAIGYVSRESSWWKKRLNYNDLKVDSPYNTYKYPGLPPGPICSPGVESVRAVINPAPVEALYFVADGKGEHVFNQNFRDHVKAKQKVRKRGN